MLSWAVLDTDQNATHIAVTIFNDNFFLQLDLQQGFFKAIDIR